MSEMVERVARAIANALAEAYREREEPSEEDHRKAASAAIAVMREPNRHMIEAGDAFQTTLAAWRVMIDEALK